MKHARNDACTRISHFSHLHPQYKTICLNECFVTSIRDDALRQIYPGKFMCLFSYSICSTSCKFLVYPKGNAHWVSKQVIVDNIDCMFLYPLLMTCPCVRFERKINCSASCASFCSIVKFVNRSRTLMSISTITITLRQHVEMIDRVITWCI